MAHIQFVDELVREYLLYRGFTSTVKAFDNDLKADKDKGFRVDKIVEQIVHYINVSDLNGFKDYWSHLDTLVFSKLEIHVQPAVRKLEYSLYKLYLVTAAQSTGGARNERITDFLSKMLPELQGQNEWRDWFMLPFIQKPEENPSFSLYFTRAWQDSVLVSLHNLLATVFQCMPQPTLTSYESVYTVQSMPVLHAKAAMWSRKQSVCSAVSGVSRGDEVDLPGNGVQLYPFAIALRVRVLQIVCGIGGLVLGAVGWLEERQKPALGLGVPAGAITVLAAATSIYYSRGFGGWVSARSRSTRNWGAPWRALGPSPCAAVPLTMLWTAAIGAHIAMLAFCIRSLMNIGCGSTTCIGVASAQLTVSITTLCAAVFMLQLDLRFDASLSPPPRQSDTHICTAVSMVPLTSVAINSGNSDAADSGGSPLGKEKEPPPLDPPI